MDSNVEPAHQSTSPPAGPGTGDRGPGTGSGIPNHQTTSRPDHQATPPETDMIFAGLVGMIDPPREEVKVAVGRCTSAGIRPVMITGDHPETAAAIAHELQLVSGEVRAITGNDLDAMSDEDLKREVESISV